MCWAAAVQMDSPKRWARRSHLPSLFFLLEMRQLLSYYTVAMNERMSIGELATAARLTRRAIRFYVSQRLLPVPLGVGRGRHYDGSHLERLKEIGRLQAAGYSLEQIGRVLAGETGVVAAGLPAPSVSREVQVELWTRLRIGQGLELSFDARHMNPTVDQLLNIRQAVAAILTRPDGTGDQVQRG